MRIFIYDTHARVKYILRKEPFRSNCPEASVNGVGRSSTYQWESLGSNVAPRLAGGAFVEPCDGAVILFSSPDHAQQFVDKDPYNTGGLVTKYQVRMYVEEALRYESTDWRDREGWRAFRHAQVGRGPGVTGAP